MFFNELDLLEIRLKEMWNVTDTFVIAEANVGHSGKPKNYILFDNIYFFRISDDIMYIYEFTQNTKNVNLIPKYIFYFLNVKMTQRKIDLM